MEPTDAFRITPFGMRVHEKATGEKCTLNQATWKVQKEDGVSLLGRIYEGIKGFLIGLKYKRLFYRVTIWLKE